MKYMGLFSEAVGAGAGGISGIWLMQKIFRGEKKKNPYHNENPTSLFKGCAKPIADRHTSPQAELALTSMCWLER
jgi:hypothetical protein